MCQKTAKKNRVNGTVNKLSTMRGKTDRFLRNLGGKQQLFWKNFQERICSEKIKKKNYEVILWEVVWG